jgi:hypothetical protein
MYLIYQFSQLVDLSIQFTDIAGVSHRVAQLIERLEVLDYFWRDVFPEEDTHMDYSDFTKYRVEEMGSNRSLDQNQSKTLLPVWSLEKVSYSPPFRDEPLVAGKYDQFTLCIAAFCLKALLYSICTFCSF